MSIIELGDKDHFRKKSNPKNAIRSGFAPCGRLTQFLALQDKLLPDDALWVNAEGAILDAMRPVGLERQSAKSLAFETFWATADHGTLAR